MPLPPSIEIKRVSGNALNPYITDIARLRIQVFREFPYLYDGSFDYEERYLRTYMEARQAVVVLAIDHATPTPAIVGASTGLPLAEETEAFRQPVEQAGYDSDTVFYCAESVLLPAYRGLGLGWRFFDEREAHAQQLGGFDYSCFCAVARPHDHPLTPRDYRPLHSLWKKRGYTPANIQARFHWKDIDQPEETEKTMDFWFRPLHRPLPA